MGEIKTKNRRPKNLAKPTTRKVTTSSTVRIHTSRTAAKETSAKKRPVPKPANTNRIIKSPKSKKSAKKKSQLVRRTTTRPTAAAKLFQPSRPLTPLPKPLDVTTHPLYEAGPGRTSRPVKPQRWSLRHNLFVILVLTTIGVLTLFIVASYANLTFQYINIYTTTDSNILKPVSMTERSFIVDAGTFQMSYPMTYEVTANSTDEINWHSTTEQNTTAQLRVYTNESDNVFTWLQANQPDYKNAKVVAPTEAIDAVNGILVEANSAEGLSMYVAYWPYQINLAEKYIIELRITFDASTEYNQRFLTDLDTFVSGLAITE